MAKSQWHKLLELVEKDDGLPVRSSGRWAREKLWYWNRYLEITTRAMVGHPGWTSGVVYVDLFAGPGVCQVRETQERIPGSAIIAANTPKPFSKLFFCELDADLANACRKRLGQYLLPDKFIVFNGDCNLQINSIVPQIPSGALVLSFLDPTGLHLGMSTVQQLSSHGPVDLLILFPDAIDVIRNAGSLYFDEPDSRLDQVLGEGSQWREIVNQSPTDGATQRKKFVELYKTQLTKLADYSHFADISIRGPSGPLYRLVYATKHERGIDFWKKSVAKEIGGQQRLFLD